MESPLPTYSIYGEHGRAPGVDWLHCESISERSRLHDWEIHPHPHQHPLLYQLCWLERGDCEASLDGRLHRLRGPSLLLMPPGAMHGFRFDPAVQGLVVTVLAQHLHKLLGEEPNLLQRLMRAPAAQVMQDEEATPIGRAASGLQQEFHAVHQAWRGMAIDAELLKLLVASARTLPDPSGQPRLSGNRAQAHVQRYRGLIEREFRRQPTQGEFAEQLGITGTQLNRVCQQVLGCSALDLLQARLLLEAQRELAYTNMSIKQIAHGLGFTDAAYFTRFYQRRTGLAPTAWRIRSLRDLQT